MKKAIAFVSPSDNTYLYSSSSLLYMPKGLRRSVLEERAATELDSYYDQKKEFLYQHGLWSLSLPRIATEMQPEVVDLHLGNLRQFLIEVTDNCNLACSYCGYKELYRNYDERKGKKQTFRNIRALIDYLQEIWKTFSHLSYKNKIMIAFYGGEPLLEMDLIRQTVEYIESLDLPQVEFGYNMTTNAMLLDRHIDYLYEKNFQLLISLDGDSNNHSYRVTKNDQNSFERVYRNVKLAQERYPDYFYKAVEFNAVLHNRNSYREIFDFVQKEFNKIPQISPLNTHGVAEEMQEEFMKMYKDDQESMKEGEFIQEDINLDNSLLNPEVSGFHLFLYSMLGNTYYSIEDLFREDPDRAYTPTGTCQPFQKRLFLTVNGKILPCERVGQDQENVLGSVVDGDVRIDTCQLADKYSEMYQKVNRMCKKCIQWNNCGQCLYYIRNKQGKFDCKNFTAYTDASGYFSTQLSLAEKYPFLYTKMVEELIRD